ncbi:MAG: hypothetical protein PHH11_01775 [Methylomonas sp.]|nr:hypothetical protein [Methylomonas sp.]
MNRAISGQRGFSSTRRAHAILLVLTFCIAMESGAEDKSNPAANLSMAELLPIAAMLIKDGNHERAINTLSGADASQEGADLSRYHTLLGMAQIGMKDYGAAKTSLQQAIKHGQTDPVIYVYLAQAHYGLQEFQPTLQAIERAGNVFSTYPALLEMKIHSHWSLKQYDAAWAGLELGQTLFPEDHKFLEKKIFYALDLELYRNAAELGKQYLAKSVAKPDDFVAIGNALRLSRQFQDAADILETARLRYPEHPTIAKVLAHTYLDQGMTHAAAAIFERAAYQNPEFISEAAELYKRAGRFHHALELNAKIPDQAAKLKQRLAILLGLQQYEMVVNMEPALLRNRLLADQSVRYALAYAAYAIGDFEQTKKHLNYVKEPGLFKQAMELQRLMQECGLESWKCG